MKKLVKKSVEYLGLSEPTSIEEINVEVSGLRQLIALAEERICRLKQSVAIAMMQIGEDDEQKREGSEGDREGVNGEEVKGSGEG